MMKKIGSFLLIAGLTFGSAVLLKGTKRKTLLAG